MMDAILTDNLDLARNLDTLTDRIVILASKHGSGYRYQMKGQNYLSDKQLDECESIVLVTSNNETFGRMFDKARCLIPDQAMVYKPWDELVKDFGENAGHIQLMIDSAVPFHIVGLFPMGDAATEFEKWYDHGMPQGMDPGFPNLKEHYRVAPGQLTVVTGIPGHGKSEFLDAILVKMAAVNECRYALYSPENNPITLHTIKLIEKFTARPFDDGPTLRLNKPDAMRAKAWINEHFFRIEPERPTIQEILRVARHAVIRHDISGLVLDPWNQIEHSVPENLNETQYISMVLTELREFAKRHQIHVWVVAHPTKIMDDKETGRKKVPDAYSIAGSAHWFNKADNILSVYRRFEDGREHDVEVHIQKIKFKCYGKIGVVFFKYDRPTGCYYPCSPSN